MLVLCKISVRFVNTLTDDNKYSLLYRDNLMQPIQILLSQKQKTFSELFSAFLKSTLNFAVFEKNLRNKTLFSIFLSIFEIYIKF